MVSCPPPPMAAGWEDRSGGVLTDTPADEGEQERRVARDLRRDLELQQAHGGTEDDDVDADDEGLASRTRLSARSFTLFPLSRRDRDRDRALASAPALRQSHVCGASSTGNECVCREALSLFRPPAGIGRVGEMGWGRATEQRRRRRDEAERRAAVGARRIAVAAAKAAAAGMQEDGFGRRTIHCRR